MLVLSPWHQSSAYPYAEAVLADAPVVYYQFEEAAGTVAADASGNLNDGEYINSGSLGFASESAESNLGYALDFDGGHVDVPNLGTHARSSIEVWLKRDTPTAGCCDAIVSTDGWDTGRIHLNINTNRIEHAVNGDNPVSVNTAETVSTDTWYHLVVTNDVVAGETKYYLDGVEVADTGDHTNMDVVFGVSGMQIGAWDGGRNFDGQMDEFAVYDSVLSAERVAAHFAAATAPLTPTIQSFTIGDSNLSSDIGIALPEGGGAVTLAWEVENADTVQIDHGTLAATATPTGAAQVSVLANTTFTLTATNAAGNVTAQVNGFVNPEVLDPMLSEFLAENDSGLLDGNGKNSDWIEIYNPNPFPLDLAGNQLRDGSEAWAFPAGSNIAASGYLIVFASGENGSDQKGFLHVNFSLNKDGEYLALQRSDGSVIDEFSPTFPPQYEDTSYGWRSDPGSQGYFQTPTPGEGNGSGYDGLLDKIDDTSFAFGRGFYTVPFDEIISASTPGASIIYTVDGSIPSESNGTRVDASDEVTPPSATLTIDPAMHQGVTTLRAAVFKSGFAPTNVDTQTYIFSSAVTAQSRASAIDSGWPSRSVNGQVFNFGMNLDKIGPESTSFTAEEVAASLESIPTLSLVTDFDNLIGSDSGIYVNAQARGRNWERPTSVELIYPDEYHDPDGNTEGFQIDAGLRIRGGYSRNPEFFKHGFRLFFRGEYGDAKLRYPLFGREGVDGFDKIDLRSSSNFDWARESDFSLGEQFTFVRDLFSRDTQGALGQAYTKSRYYHLYLNGTYWGIYQTEERPEASFGASYFGGNSDDFDTVKSSNHVGGFTTEATDGTLDAFEDLWNRCREIGLRDPSNENYYALQGLDANGVRDPALPVLLDVDNLIDYMLVIFWTGDGDAVLSNFLQNNRANNWFGIRNRNGDEGFRFFAHDAEHTLGNSSSRRDRTGPFRGSNQNNFLYANPQWMHQDLMENAEYRLRFADRVQKHFFRSGALTEDVTIERFKFRADQVRPALKAYAARWADARYTRSYNTGLWESEIQWVTDSWMPGRTAIVLNQLRADALYPDFPSPLFTDEAGAEQADGEVPAGFQLHLTAPAGATNGTIYYTLDGSDPRTPAGQNAPSAVQYTEPITVDGPKTVNARLLLNGEWSALTAASFHTGIATPSDQNLVVSQIHYHPNADVNAGGNAQNYEFIELMNIGALTLDLRSLRLREDVRFEFSSSTYLAPGERAQLVSNAPAFAEKYAGRPIRVLGEFSGNLSNSGGRLSLLSDSDSTIRDFSFDDKAPWPEQADGDGYGLTLIKPESNPDHSDPANWRRSLAVDASPGESDAVIFVGNPDSDIDGDGLPAILEYALGTSDAEVDKAPWIFSSSEGNNAPYQVRITRRVNADDVIWIPEISGDLITWSEDDDQLIHVSTPASDPNYVNESYSYEGTAQRMVYIRIRVVHR
ncbi:MAG: lamin tail domain-containing protein [Verrucomicrobiales bacterium]